MLLPFHFILLHLQVALFYVIGVKSHKWTLMNSLDANGKIQAISLCQAQKVHPWMPSLDSVLDQQGARNKITAQRPEYLGLNPDSTCVGETLPSCLTFLCLYKMMIIIIPISQGCCKN